MIYKKDTKWLKYSDLDKSQPLKDSSWSAIQLDFISIRGIKHNDLNLLKLSLIVKDDNYYYSGFILLKDVSSDIQNQDNEFILVFRFIELSHELAKVYHSKEVLFELSESPQNSPSLINIEFKMDYLIE